MNDNGFCNPRGVLATLDALWNLPHTINQRLTHIMTSIDELRAAVSGVETNVATGFTALEGAMAELASDIANLPNSADVEAEAARLSAVATTISEQTASFSAAIRDAIPTETVPNPEPTEPVDTGAGDTPVDGGADVPADGGATAPADGGDVPADGSADAPADGTPDDGTGAPADGGDFPTGADGTVVEGGATDGSATGDTPAGGNDAGVDAGDGSTAPADAGDGNGEQ